MQQYVCIIFPLSQHVGINSTSPTCRQQNCENLDAGFTDFLPNRHNAWTRRQRCPLIGQVTDRWMACGYNLALSDSGDDLVRILYPLERPSLDQFGEEALHGIQPRGGCQCEVEASPRMPRQPRLDLWVLVGGVVVDDGMDDLALRQGGLGDVKKSDNA
jgi:hypothetical protein